MSNQSERSTMFMPSKRQAKRNKETKNEGTTESRKKLQKPKGDGRYFLKKCQLDTETSLCCMYFQRKEPELKIFSSLGEGLSASGASYLFLSQKKLFFYSYDLW